MTKKVLILMLAVLSFVPSFAQEDPGFDVARVALHRNYQDIDYNGPSASVVPGTFYGLHTFGSYLLGGELADNLQLGFYFNGSFGMSYTFKGTDNFEKQLGLNFGVGAGAAAAYFLSRTSLIGFKTYYLTDFDRISFSGLVFEPSVRMGPIFLQTSLMSPMGVSKDQLTESFDVLAMLVNDRAGFGVRYSARSAYNGTALNTRANLSQIHLVLELH